MKSLLLTIFFAIILDVTYAQDTGEKIRQLNADMARVFNNNDMNAVSAFYLDSAVISGGRMHITGRNNIDNYWSSMKDKDALWKLEVDKIEDYGAIIIQRGRSYLSFTGSDGVRRESNVRFVLIWKKTGDSYRMLYDVYSSL